MDQLLFGENGYVVLSPQLQELEETGSEIPELLARVQVNVAPDLLRSRGLIFYDTKVNYTIIFEVED